MKKLYKYFSAAVLSGILCVSFSLTASAQHHDGGGGGGSAGGGGGHIQSAPAPAAPRVSAPSNYSRPAAPSSTHSAVRTYNNNGHANYQRSGTVQRNYYSGHAGVGANTRVSSYRTYQGSVYGHNHPGYSGAGVRVGFLPGHASYHYNHGYYGSYYAPRLGFSVGFLPFGYYPFWFDDDEYFYSQGLYYQYDNDEYTVVEPPVGAEVSTLPSNAQSIVINGQQFYEVNGVYYEPITKDDGTLSYQIAGKDGELNTDDQNNVDNGPPPMQIGDVVPNLPPNCRKININGEKLYLSEDGVYYKAIVDQNGNKSYKIVGLPDDDGDQQQQQAPPQQ